MPELPEVQTIVDDLNALDLFHLPITATRIFWPRVLAVPSPQAFQRQMKGKTIARVWRRGKYIVFDISEGGSLLIHLRMSGRLHWVLSGTERSRHEQVILHFKNGWELRFYDPRKFGRCYWVEDSNCILGSLGPEPLEPQFTLKVFKERLNARRRRLKPLLLDQSIIAGLGNIYVDEALWESRIHPNRMPASLLLPEMRALHRSIPKVLKRGLKNFGTTLGNGKANFYSISKGEGRNRSRLKVFRRTGFPCPRCQTVIERLIVSQRSTHICPQCQRI